MTGGHPPIPTQRAQITAEAHRCVTARAQAQHDVAEGLFLIDALDQRIDALMDALRQAPA